MHYGHEIAKLHDRWYHGEAYLFVLCYFCGASSPGPFLAFQFCTPLNIEKLGMGLGTRLTSVMALHLSDLFSRSIASSIDRVSVIRRAWWIMFRPQLLRSPRTIITVQPLFYLTCRRVPDLPAFQRETLKSWEWAWGWGYLCLLQLWTHTHTYTPLIYTCSVTLHLNVGSIVQLPYSGKFLLVQIFVHQTKKP